MRKFTWALTGAAALGLALAGAGAASASPAGPATHPHVVVGQAYTSDLAGYEATGNALKAYNDARGTFTMEPGSTSNAAVFLQESSITGGLTVEEALVQGNVTNGCPTDQWVIEGRTGIVSSPGPLSITSLHVLPGDTCVGAGVPYYMEVHFSTLHQEIAYLAGPNEFNNVNVLAEFSLPSFIHPTFYAPAIGVHFTATSLPTENTPQACFTRVGLTQLLSPHAAAGGTNGRLTLNAESTTEVSATVSGLPPTVTNPIYLNDTAMATGSAFCVNATP
jgi:hypothetical protein